MLVPFVKSFLADGRQQERRVERMTDRLDNYGSISGREDSSRNEPRVFWGPPLGKPQVAS
jgi:hypothetical protein